MVLAFLDRILQIHNDVLVVVLAIGSTLDVVQPPEKSEP